MPTPELVIEATRGRLVESTHRITAAVVDSEGRILESAGNPDLPTWWRSAAKPFQALPVVLEGAADRFGLTDQEVALACASHNSEPRHLAIVSGLMRRLGITEDALACGPHPPLSAEIAQYVTRTGIPLTPRWSNCSGKHVAMIALAMHRDWPVAGYQEISHPVQQRILNEIARWSGLDESAIDTAPDGCTAACFALPIRAMALAYARLGMSGDPAARRIVAAMMAHPLLIAGKGRLCSELIEAWPGQVIAKVGALGVYCAALPSLRIGIALKVEDGDTRASGVALLAILRAGLGRFGGENGPDWERLTRHSEPELRNSRGVVTGILRSRGSLRFSDR